MKFNVVKTKPVLIVLYCVYILVQAAGCQANGDTGSSRPENTIPSIPVLDPQSIERGQKVYAQYCAACHGADLEGQANWKEQNADGTFRAPPHDAEGHTWHHSDAQLIEAINRGGARLPADIGGTSNMPGYEAVLTAQEISDVLNYIKSTWPEEIQDIQWQQTSQTRP
jgi:S-disulfanyl-L-cysteine oxidoreductase SoxD